MMLWGAASPRPEAMRMYEGGALVIWIFCFSRRHMAHQSLAQRQLAAHRFLAAVRVAGQQGQPRRFAAGSKT